VEHMGEERKVYKVSWESPKERDHLIDRGVDGIKMYLRKIGLVCVWSGFSWLRVGTDGGLDEPLGSDITELVSQSASATQCYSILTRAVETQENSNIR
jgi:hypothetical protein